MKKWAEFGEVVAGFEVRVFNEREVRAAAGVVFLFAFMAFMNGFLTGDNEPTKLMISVFLFDFSVRIFISPKYAPSMVLGRWLVNNQTPEYIGAPQKRWAWGLGFVLALTMFYLVVLNDVRGPVNILVCGLCLGLLFFEAALGICVGCKIYNIFHKQDAQYCPGGTCDLSAKRSKIQQLDWGQKIVFTASLFALFYWAFSGIISFIIFGNQ